MSDRETTIRCRAMLTAMVVFVAATSRAEEIPPSPAIQTDVKKWIDIQWSLGPDLPQGFQDSDGGMIGSQLITACGFCSGGLPEDNRRKPGRYPRGFLKNTWAWNVEKPDSGWVPLPDFPGPARQGLFSAVIGDALYFWGGFSYTEPYCYQDGYRLAKSDNGSWVWTRLPDLPWKLTSAAMAAVDSKIYLCGGADYDTEAGFTTAHDRHKRSPRLGAKLLVFDVRQPDNGWQALPECPGTPRFVHAFQSVNGKLYLIGGATGDLTKDGTRYGYCTVVNNWSFDPATTKWSRLRDLPVSSGNFPKSSNLVYQNRYIILPGGHQYPHVEDADGSVRPAYGKASFKRKESGLHNDVFVYDTKTDLFGTGDAMPIDDNLPMVVVREDKVYLLGGETGGGEIDGKYYGHHPDLLLIGTMKLNAGAPN